MARSLKKKLWANFDPGMLVLVSVWIIYLSATRDQGTLSWIFAAISWVFFALLVTSRIKIAKRTKEEE